MKKNYLYNLTLSVVNILFPILSFPYASHLLGPEGIGKIQFIVSFALYFSMTAALGIPIYGINETAKVKDHPEKLSFIFSELTIIYFINSLLLTIIYCILILLLPYFSHDRHLYLYAAAIIFLSFLYVDWFYSGIEAFRLITIRSIVVKLLSLAWLYLFVRTAADLRQYLLVTMFSITGNNIISFFLIGKKTHLVFSNLQLRRHLKPLLYIFSTTIAASIYTYLDTVLLGFLSNEYAVGLYTAGIKLTRITLPIVTSVGAVLIPRITRTMANQDISATQQLLNTAYHFIILLSVPILMGLVILAPEFITVFSGSKFIKATLCMQILSLLPLLVGLGYFFAFLILVPGGKNKEMFFSVACGVLVFFIANFLLSPVLNETGTAIANIATELTVTLLYLFYIKKHFPYTFSWKPFVPAVICSLVFIPVVRLIHLLPLKLYLSLSLSVLSCGIVYACGQLFVFRNQIAIRLLKQTFQKIPSLKKSV